MKKLIIVISFLVVTIPSYTFLNNKNDNYAEGSVSLLCNYGQCQATAQSTGNRCKHCVSNSGDKYCYQHK